MAHRRAIAIEMVTPATDSDSFLGTYEYGEYNGEPTFWFKTHDGSYMRDQWSIDGWSDNYFPARLNAGIALPRILVNGKRVSPFDIDAAYAEESSCTN